MAELKHIGRVKSTNKKVLVAYRTLPGDAHHCLIVPTENLPDIYHDSIINLVESSAGQDAYEFAEVLDRTQFPDGARMLPSLHASGRLIKVPTSNIEMTPTPGYSILLSELNQIIAEQRGVAVDDLAITDGKTVDPKTASVPLAKTVDESRAPDTSVAAKDAAKTTSATVEAVQTSQPASFESPEVEAKFYRSQADKLAKEAAAMRRKAEELAPTKKVK
jgi:hypothetical protein